MARPEPVPAREASATRRPLVALAAVLFAGTVPAASAAAVLEPDRAPPFARVCDEPAKAAIVKQANAAATDRVGAAVALVMERLGTPTRKVDGPFATVLHYVGAQGRRSKPDPRVNISEHIYKNTPAFDTVAIRCAFVP